MTKTKLKPANVRRKPVQERSSFTVESILEATIQVLLEQGPRKLTTTKVAERAGVSVGSLYQYFPNRESLFRAVLEQHLKRIAGRVIASFEECKGQPYKEVFEHVIDAFIDAKTERVDVSLALYAMSSELENIESLRAIMYGTLSDFIVSVLREIKEAEFEDLQFTAMMFHSVMTSTIKAVLERGASPHLIKQLRRELKTICLAYLEQHIKR